METKDRLTLAELLRKSAMQTISESRFWIEMKDLTERLDAPILKLATGSAESFWQLFHQKRKFFRLSAQPDPEELRQATDELNLIAAVLETGWQLPALNEADTQR